MATENTRCERWQNKVFVTKTYWKCDLEQSPGTHERQQNEVFERKGLWEMWHEQILGMYTVQDNEKRLRCQVTNNWINKSKNTDDVFKSFQRYC